MKWKNTAFQFKSIADLTKKELDEAGIKKAIHIICEHIW